MFRHAWLLVVGLLLSVVVSERAHGRIRQLWTEQQIADKSDLIVMAKVVEVRDTGVATTIPNIARGNAPIAAVEMEATFEVSAVLKGTHEKPKLVFVYLRQEKHEASRGEPEFVGFDAAEKKQYLLFLKREEDGRYSAVVGQTDPADAVRKVGRSRLIEPKAASEPADGRAAIAPADHVEWLGRKMREVQNLKAGMSRAELLTVVQEEGGVSRRVARRFALRGCPYVKVDVTFRAIGAPDDATGTASSEDEVTKISAPFLEWSIAD